MAGEVEDSKLLTTAVRASACRQSALSRAASPKKPPFYIHHGGTETRRHGEKQKAIRDNLF
jgi:hypothetical protein